MSLMRLSRWMVGVAVCLVVGPTQSTRGNGGPFLLKYPNGDPAARGNVAMIDDDLRPTREERLRVVKEDLKITFVNERAPGYGIAPNSSTTPLAIVSAEYTIENPTSQDIQIQFGFPILRGTYTPRPSMSGPPNLRVLLNGKDTVNANVISNSGIYLMIRQRAREVIECSVAGDSTLADLVAIVRATGTVRQRAANAVRYTIGGDAALKAVVARDRLLKDIANWNPDTYDEDHKQARLALSDHLTRARKWSPQDAALMVEFASLDLGPMQTVPRSEQNLRAWFTHGFIYQNGGPLGAIGEQKATQLFARLAGCFDPNAAIQYESIFTAWGGDVRERSVDLETGQVRPREITVDPNSLGEKSLDTVAAQSDPTLYARVDYLDTRVQLSEEQKSSCRTILKNLPVVFTFAPMNLLHYEIKFPAHTTQRLAVSYMQYAYRDTREPASYQLAYVVHPASFWKEFGPINLVVATPAGVGVRASVPCQEGGTEEREAGLDVFRGGKGKRLLLSVRRGVVKDKTGELFVAIDGKTWDRLVLGKVTVETQQQARK